MNGAALRCAPFVLLALFALRPGGADAAPIDTVVAAFAAEDAAPLERVRLFVERAGVADVYYVDRIRPRRLRMLKNPRQGGLEAIIIDGSQWLRGPAGWENRRHRPVPWCRRWRVSFAPV